MSDKDLNEMQTEWYYLKKMPKQVSKFIED